MNAPLKHTAGVPVVWKNRAFDMAPKLKIVEVCESRIPTIAEIVDSIPAHELPRGFKKFGEVRINDDLIPRGVWHLVRPRYVPDRAITVMLYVPLKGGGGGGSSGGQKNPIATVAAIAVLLVATAVTFGALGPAGLALLGSSFAFGGIGAGLLGASIGIAGSLAIAALVPPPSLAAPQIAAGVTTSGSTTAPAAASLTGNILSPSSPLPRVVGTMRLFPPLLCNPLVEVVGDLEYAEAVFGLAGPHALSDLRVGDTATIGIAELEQQLVEGKDGDAIQTLVTRQSYTLNANTELTGHTLDPTTQYQLLDQGNPGADLPQFQPFVSRNAPDEIWINLNWPEGLFTQTDTTVAVNQAVRVQIRRRGASDWINLPEVHFSQNEPGPFQKVIRLKWGAIPSPVNTPSSNQAPVYAFKTVPGQSVAPSTSGWTTDASFSNGAGNDVLSAATFATSNVKNTELYGDKVIFYFDPVAFPQDFYEMQVVRSAPYLSASFTPSNYQYSGTVYDWFNYYTSAGIARIPIDHSQYHDRVIVTRVSSVWNENPVQSTDFSTISVRVHSRALDQLSVLASGYVKDWDGSGWNTLTTTSNPAPNFREVLGGNLGSSPVPAALINDREIVAWRTQCINMGYTVNAVIQGKTYNDALQMVASCGYARFRQNERYGVFLDKDRSAETPIQIFTPRNMTNFNWTRAFTKRPSGIRANFVDADDNYNTGAEIIVWDDPDVQDADGLSQITYDGLVYEADVIYAATNNMGQLKYRMTFYQGDTDWESIVCQRGDLVAVQHDVLVKKAGFSKIASVFRSGGLVTGIALDGSIPVNTTAGFSQNAHISQVTAVSELGQTTGISIRLKGGAGIIVKQVTGNGDLTTVNFMTPFSDPGVDGSGNELLDQDCLISAGPLGSEYKRHIVYAVAPKSDLQATLTFVDEAPQLWQ